MMPSLPLEDDIPFKVKYTCPRPPKPKPRSRKRKSLRRRQQSVSSVNFTAGDLMSPTAPTMTTTTRTNGVNRRHSTASVVMMTDNHGQYISNGNGIGHGHGHGLEDEVNGKGGGDFAIGQAVVRPNTQWMSLKRYKNFVRKDETFSVNDYVFVENPNADPHHLSSDTSDSSDSEPQPSTTRRRSVHSSNGSHKSSTPTTAAPKARRWVARVDEICASESGPLRERVFLRVSWLYRPEDLPAGRQYYHGKRELVMSNHVDVVDALSVSGRAEVKRWRELDEEDDGLEMYWRQEVDVIGGGLSEIRTHCTCRRRYNPDRLMLWCDNCALWLHEECVVADVLRRHSAASKAARRASGRQASISTALALTSLGSPTTTTTAAAAAAETNGRKGKPPQEHEPAPWEERGGCGGDDDGGALEGLRREMRPRLVVERGKGGKRGGVKSEENGGGVGRPRVQMRRKVWGAGSEGGVVWEDVECLRCRRRVE